MKVNEFMKHYEGKNEHYPISDEFVKKYQQSHDNKKGYVHYAMEQGLLVCKEKAEPNQKWHLSEAYMQELLEKEQIQSNDDAKTRYNNLKCPELLLWIAEAAGVDSEIIAEAARKASETIDKGTNGYSRIAACGEIKKIIRWSLIESNLIKNQHSVLK